MSAVDGTLRRVSQSPPNAPHRVPSQTTLRQRLADLRGPAVAPRPLDARALAALAANPGCRRRALLDGAGVDKTALAAALGAPSSFGQSQFAIVRGNAFEARVKADGGTELLRLLHEQLGALGAPEVPAPPPAPHSPPDLTAAGPQGRAARTALALREASTAREWTLLDHPMLALDVAGTPAYLEPDAVVVHPDGRWTVVEIKSFPVIDGVADAAKVGAAARQSAVYVLALERVAQQLTQVAGAPSPTVGHSVLLVCPRNFSNQPTASAVDVRKQRATTARQLARLTRVEEIAAELPAGATFDPAAGRFELTQAVEAVEAAYAPDCLSACELAFHCRERARAAGAVTTLGRGARGELGGLDRVEQALAASGGLAPDLEDPASAALRRAARLRAQALEAAARSAAPPSRSAAGPAPHCGHDQAQGVPCR
ncbi:hypothetical protein [Streptomyces sp. NPDC006879]|uniref:hypothetical protein n=1 Tax=Streptomyces sp. NPDC006879 TaxID=3364767 RepID=UPI0036C210AB